MRAKHDIRTLTNRFFQGETTLGEERLLYQLYRRNDVPQDLLPYRDIFLDMAAMELAAKTIPLQKHRFSRRWLMAASVVLALGLGSILLFQRSQQDECVAYIYGKKTTDPAVVMGELERSIISMKADEQQDNVESLLNEMFNME